MTLLARSLRPLRTHAAGVLAAVVIAAGLAAVVDQDGLPATKVDLGAGAVWLASSRNGQLALLDGPSAEIATRVTVATPGTGLQVRQLGSSAYAVDPTAGTVLRVDGASWQPGNRVQMTDGSSSAGLDVVASDKALYVLDRTRGLVTEADTRSLARRGQPVAAKPTSAVVDGSGRLWMLDADTGDVAVLPGADHKSWRGVTTGAASEVLDVGGRAVLVDAGRRRLRVLDSDGPGRVVDIDVDRDDATLRYGGSVVGDAVLAASGAHGTLSVTHLGHGSARVVTIARAGDVLGAPAEAVGRAFVADYTTGRVVVVDLDTSAVVRTDPLVRPGTPFELLTRDGFAFYNDPGSEKAGVIGLDGRARPVQKYDPHSSRSATSQHHGNSGDGDRKANHHGRQNPADPGEKQPQPSPPEVTPPPVGTAPLDETVPLGPNDQGVGTGGTGGTGGAGTGGSGGPGPAPGTTGVPTGPTPPPPTSPAGQPSPSPTPTEVPSVPVPDARLTVVLAGPDQGTVSGSGISCPSTCSATQAPGGQVTLHAGRAVDWSGDPGSRCGNSEVCSFTIAGDTAVTATYAAETARMTVAIQGEDTGTVRGPEGFTCPGGCTQDVHQGSVTLDAGRRVGWSGVGCPDGQTCTFDLSRDITVTASYPPLPVKLTVVVTGRNSGTVTGPNGISCADRCTYQVPKAPIMLNAGRAVDWSGPCSGSRQTCSFTPRGDVTATATYKLTEGDLQTGDDCDLIHWELWYGVAPAGTVQFSLWEPSPLTWWKEVSLPVRGGGYVKASVQDGAPPDLHAVPTTSLDTSRSFGFAKAKFLGVHTQLGFTWNGNLRMVDRSRLVFTWENDKC